MRLFAAVRPAGLRREVLELALGAHRRIKPHGFFLL